MTNTVVAQFDDITSVKNLIGDLQRTAFPMDAVTLSSEEPIEIPELPKRGRISRLRGFAIVGGFVGALAALTLTIVTTRRMGLVTGGMPIFAPWPFGIIVFELTALGAILATLCRTVMEAGLLAHAPPRIRDARRNHQGVILALDCSSSSQAGSVVRACQLRGGHIVVEGGR